MLVEVNLDIVASIVALTANAMKGDRDEYLAAGMMDYLSKPVDRDALLDVLTKVARARR
jgi:CheY-like chemotaxis protein